MQSWKDNDHASSGEGHHLLVFFEGLGWPAKLFDIPILVTSVSGSHYGCAMQYRERNEDEGRDTFKMLKSQLLGDNSALLYSKWAIMELASGTGPATLGL